MCVLPQRSPAVRAAVPEGSTPYRTMGYGGLDMPPRRPHEADPPSSVDGVTPSAGSDDLTGNQSSRAHRQSDTAAGRSGTRRRSSSQTRDLTQGSVPKNLLEPGLAAGNRGVPWRNRSGS